MVPVQQATAEIANWLLCKNYAALPPLDRPPDMLLFHYHAHA